MPKDNNEDEQVAAASLLKLLCSGPSDAHEPKDGESQMILNAKENKKKSVLSSVQESSENPSKSEELINRRHSYPISTSKGIYVPKKKAARDRAKKLPEVLMELLTRNQYQDVMCFLPDNKNFIVTNTKAFAEKVMTKHFKMSKFGCFLNKLTKYGFTYALLDNDQHLFFHPLFHRSDWVSLQKIEYRPVKSETGRKNPTSDLSRKRRADFTAATEIQPTPASKVLRFEEANFIGNLDLPREMLYNSDSCNESSSHLSSLMPSSNSSFASHLSSPSFDHGTTSQLIHTATKHVVAKAIDCLLFDETHTLDLLARRGREVHSRRLSLPS